MSKYLSGISVVHGLVVGASTGCVPVVILDGEPGEDAHPIPGPVGPTGAAGANGSNGAQGLPGVVVYLDGEQGEPGDPIPGPRGSDGTAGATGATGAQGLPGVAIILDGEQGEDGFTFPGPMGPQGTTGATGATGLQGLPGVVIYLDGERGEEGMPIPGPIGATGATGATGGTGATGATGAQGLPGVALMIEGEPGQDGLDVPLGAVVPAAQILDRISRAAGDVLYRDTNAWVGFPSTSFPGHALHLQVGSTPVYGPDGIVSAVNQTGSTVAVGAVGYLDAAGDFRTTTTANLDGVQWAVAITGPTAGNIGLFAVRGNCDVIMTANVAVGEFVTTSTTAGRAAPSSVMRPDVFGVVTLANTSGAGGQARVLLLTGTRFVATSSTVFAQRVLSHADYLFTATISGAPSTTSVVYTPVSGSETTIVPASGNELFRLRLFNSTRSTYRNVISVNAGTNTITTESSTDAWANGDTITAESQATSSGSGTNHIFEYDGTNATALAAIPALARAVVFDLTNNDSGAAGQAVFLHPSETFASSKYTGNRNQVAGVSMVSPATVALIGRRFGLYSEANGATSKITALALVGYYLATP